MDWSKVVNFYIFKFRDLYLLIIVQKIGCKYINMRATSLYYICNNKTNRYKIIIWKIIIYISIS